MESGAAEISLEEIPQTFIQWSFLIQYCTTPSLSPKLQKEKFQAEHHTQDVMTGMPYPFPS